MYIWTTVDYGIVLEVRQPITDWKTDSASIMHQPDLRMQFIQLTTISFSLHEVNNSSTTI